MQAECMPGYRSTPLKDPVMCSLHVKAATVWPDMGLDPALSCIH